MLVREVHVRQSHKALQALCIGVFACLASMALAVGFLSLASGCYHARPQQPQPDANPCMLGTDERCGCAFSYVRPAYLCPGYRPPNHDGCHWSCSQ